MHVIVHPHAISCDNLTKQGNIQAQSTAIESFDFTRSEILGDDEIHHMCIMLPLRFNGARIVCVNGQ